VLLRGDEGGTIESLGIIIRVLGTKLSSVLASGRFIPPLSRFLATGRCRRAIWDVLNSVSAFLFLWPGRFGDYSGADALACSRLEDLAGDMAVFNFAVRQIN
jgi:hypothetical protein